MTPKTPSTNTNSQVVTLDTLDLGNTNSKSRVSPSKMWYFTLNNYSPTEVGDLVTLFRVFRYVIGKEVGEEGTPHLQGYVKFDRKVRPKSIVKNDRIHWEKCKGTEKQNIEYCIKDGDYVTNIPDIPEPLIFIKPDELYPWQKEVYDMCTSPCRDRRSIYWYWEGTGNMGKSELCRTMAITLNAMIANGKAKDVFSRILLLDYPPKVVLFDLVRSREEYVSYEAIEAIKNGVVASGKYEGGQRVFNSPHVIVLANYPPDYDKLSQDRWKVTELGERVSATLW